jgi:ribosome maturation factor RimP
MIAISKIKELVEAQVNGTNLFAVEVKVTISNKINILIDSFDGISISDCINVSKGVENSLDREDEDFEIEVSSAGLDAAFQVPEQYQKNLNKEVKVYTHDGKKHEGVLSFVDETKIKITYDEKVRVEGKKKKELVTQVEEYFFESDDSTNKIKDTKIIISFK